MLKVAIARFDWYNATNMSIEKSSPEILLDELRHSFDTAYSSVKKYTTKTFTVFGAELTMLLFYMKGEELDKLKNLFVERNDGWYIFAIIAALTFIVSATLFVLTLASDRRWQFPPDERVLILRDQYKKIESDDMVHELIKEYDDAIAHCVKKVHGMKIMSDIGTYFLIGGVFCLLIIKVFGV